jgi:hypothetical protein
MKLEELAKQDRFEILLMSYILPNDKEYQKNIDKGLPFFTAKELDEIEKDKQKKLTYEEINEILSRKGMIMKLATFKKYINLDLISSSVGRVKKTSVGLYQPDVIREINFIKYLLFSNIDLKYFYNEYGTNAYNIITSTMEADFYLPENIVDSDGSGETYQNKLKRMISEICENKIITPENKFEIMKKTDRVAELYYESLDLLIELEKDLKEISIPNPLAFLILNSLKTSPKHDIQKTEKT